MPEPVCRHFGACGGCALQDLSPEQYLETKRRQIVDALARQGIANPPLAEIVSVPPCSRRRATLKVQKIAGETHIGFHVARSHVLLDIRACHVLTPGLFQLARGLRELFAQLLSEGEGADLYVLEAENGFDLAISELPSRKIPGLITQIAAAGSKLGLLRVTSGGELLYESAVPEICFGTARVKLPSKAFLQPTREGEAALQALVGNATGKAKRTVDLFAGCGTFTLSLAERSQVYAVDADGAMLRALAAAARATSGMKPVATERRDLFRQPLSPAELKPFHALILDPPRAGALAQVKQLSSSGVPRIAYVSCDAASFARDTRVLIDGGFQLDWIVGVDQFLWSAHIELAAAFSR